jgi:hypothetical protein
MNYFNENGRRIPTDNYRVFDQIPKNYYQIKQPKINYEEIYSNSIQFGGVSSEFEFSEFKSRCEKLKQKIQNQPEWENLLKGAHAPFICRKINTVNDLGNELESVDLTNFQRIFNSIYPEKHFKAVLQGDSKLPGKIQIDPHSRYEDFIAACQKGTVVGWYFPQALQEFDIESQRRQMSDLPNTTNICLSGGIDITAALIGTPNLLISEDFYAPILCLSAYVHSDPRLILLIKSYGPHMEFWCMTQMLTKNITQVSEQWSGGLSIYSA